MLFGRLSSFVHQVAASVLQNGSVAVDATVGNGHDTLFLARAVGALGEVHGFDVQPQALVRARCLLGTHGLADQVTLHGAGHERMAEMLPGRLHGHVDAVMFNLGFLPGADSGVTTRPDTTIAALDAALGLLRSGGIVTLMLYSGHRGGAQECKRVLAHLRTIDSKLAQVALVNMHNHADPQARLAIVERNSSGQC